MHSSIWKGALSFGLINIPVKLMKAEIEKGLHFKLLDEVDLAPISFKKINTKTGKEVPFKRITKGFEFKKNRYVVMTEKDFEVANIEATGLIDIESFVNLNDIDLMFIERPYYLVPEKTGIKGYFLLTEAMRKCHKVAIAKIVLSKKQHLVLILEKDGHLVLEIMRFSHEILNIDKSEYFSNIKTPKFSTKEINMAVDLVEGMTEKWNANHFKDTYYFDLKKIIDKKIKGGKIKSLIPVKRLEESASNVLDLMPLLQKSLKNKKPRHKLQTTKALRKKIK
ncbi:MAG: Ku protein [Bacteriovorax sp.]|nr:Ku protein [Bacteriovorax sp.]